MTTSTVRNIVILGLVQIGAIVFTVLSAGVTLKWWTPVAARYRFVDLTATEIAARYGWLLLLFPVVWVPVAVYLLQDEERSEDAKTWAVFAGLALTVGILVMWCLTVGRVWVIGFGGR